MKSNSVLRAIARELHRKRPTRRKRRTRHCDKGLPIDLRYDDSFYRPRDQAGGQASASSRDFSTDNFATPFAGSEPGNVEAFEDEEDQYAPAPWGTGQLEDEEAENPGAQSYGGVRSFSEEGETPVWGTAELEEIDGSSSTAGPQAQSRSRATSEEAVEAPVWGTGELEELAGSAEPSRETPQPAEDPMRAAAASVPRNHDPETAAFQSDLKAILAGEKAHPSTADPSAAATSASTEEEEPASTSAPPRASGHTHETFEKMGANMSLATTYNLGSFALDRQMDAFDGQLDRDERAREQRRQQRNTPRAAAASTRVSSAEYAQDLAVMRTPVPNLPSAQSCSPPFAEAATGPAALLVPAAEAIAGGVVTQVLGNQGDVTWELDQLNGIKSPGDDPGKAGPPQYRDVILDVQSPASSNYLGDEIWANFRVRFQCNGRSLGNIQVTNNGVNDAVGWALHVRGQISNDANIHPTATDPNSYAAVRVNFFHRFTRSIGSDVLAELILTLFGNGTHRMESRWIQAATFSIPAANPPQPHLQPQSENPS